MKRRMCINVTTKTGRVFGFPFEGDPKFLEEWRAEGLDIDEILNTIPECVVACGLKRPWVFAQDAWQWLRLW